MIVTYTLIGIIGITAVGLVLYTLVDMIKEEAYGFAGLLGICALSAIAIITGKLGL